MTKILHLSEAEFDATFSLRPNHLNPNASWVTGDTPGCLFETYGEELAFVRRQDPRTIWTVVDGEENLSVISGYHVVNRIGYLISTTPAPEGESIHVSILNDSTGA